MRILQVATSLGTGGVQGQVRVLSSRLARAGHEVRVLGLYGGETLRGLDPRVRQATLGLRAGHQGDLARAVPRVRRAARAFAPDVVHTHAFHATFAGRMASVRAPWALVSTVHSAQEGGDLHLGLARATFGMSDAVTVVGRAARAVNEYRGSAPLRRLRIVHNGLDLETLTEPEDRAAERAQVRAELGVGNAPLVVAVGRLTPAKDYPTLVRATSLLRHALPSVRVVAAGEGTERPRIEALVAELGLGETFTLLGTRDDVPRLLRAADVFVMSSAWEGLPLVAAEAMWQGTRVVATDVPGIMEVTGPHAQLATKESAESVAHALHEALTESPWLRARETSAARERVREQFDATRMVAQYEDLYRQVLARR